MERSSVKSPGRREERRAEDDAVNGQLEILFWKRLCGDDIRSVYLYIVTALKSSCCVCGLSVLFASPKKYSRICACRNCSRYTSSGSTQPPDLSSLSTVMVSPALVFDPLNFRVMSL